MKMYLFSRYNKHLIVKAPTAFMACCYANQYLEYSVAMKFETSDAIELDIDDDSWVVARIDGAKTKMLGFKEL